MCFANEITALEWIAMKLSTDDCCVIVVFSPKYHCEIAGEGIELDWGFSKKYMRRKFKLSDKKHDFKGCVDKALNSVPVSTSRKYAGRVYGYMRAYKLMEDKGEVGSYATVEKFLKEVRCHRSSVDQDTALIEADVQATLSQTNA